MAEQKKEYRYIYYDTLFECQGDYENCVPVLGMALCCGGARVFDFTKRPEFAAERMYKWFHEKLVEKKYTLIGWDILRFDVPILYSIDSNLLVLTRRIIDLRQWWYLINGFKGNLNDALQFFGLPTAPDIYQVYLNEGKQITDNLLDEFANILSSLRSLHIEMWRKYHGRVPSPEA